MNISLNFLTGIVIRLHGYSMVTWTKPSRGSPYYKPSETFRDIDKYFDERVTLFGSSMYSNISWRKCL